MKNRIEMLKIDENLKEENEKQKITQIEQECVSIPIKNINTLINSLGSNARNGIPHYAYKRIVLLLKASCVLKRITEFKNVKKNQ